MKWYAFQNEFSNLFLLFYWIKELILVLQLFSFAFKFVQTIMYCICIVAKPNHVILYIQNQSCPRNWEFCCELLESECTSDPNRLLNRGHLQIHYFGFMRRMLDCCYLGTVLCYIVKILDFTWLTWFIIARNKHPVLWTMYDQPRTFAWLERRRGAVTILPCIHFSSFPGKTKTKAEGGKLRASKNAKSFKLKMN